MSEVSVVLQDVGKPRDRLSSPFFPMICIFGLTFMNMLSVSLPPESQVELYKEGQSLSAHKWISLWIVSCVQLQIFDFLLNSILKKNVFQS